MWYTHRFAHSKYANRVILCLYYIECELIAVFIKILFDNWRHVFRPSVIHVPVKCPRSGGIWSPEWTFLKGILAWIGENLNNNFQKSKMPGGGCWSFNLTDTFVTFYLARGEGSANEDWARWEILHRPAHDNFIFIDSFILFFKQCLFVILMSK